MRRLHRGALLLAIALLLPLLGGCLDSHEIETLAIVSGLAVDRGEEKTFRVTAELISSKNEQTSSLSVSAEGDTVYDCIRSLVSPAGKTLYLSHCKVGILSLDAAEEGLPSLVDWANRDTEGRLTMSLLLAEGRAADLFAEQPEAGTAVAFNIADSLNTGPSSVANLSIHNFIDLGVDVGKTPYAPVISLSEDGAPEVKKLSFLKENVPAGLLSGEELLYFSLLRRDGGRRTLTVKNDRGAYTVELKPERSDFQFSHEDGGLQFRFDYQLGAELVDISYPFDPHDEDAVARMEVEIECVVKNGLKALAARSQSEFQLDIAGLGSVIYRKEPAFFESVRERYSELYRNAAFSFDTRVTLRGTGVSGVTVFAGERGEAN